MATFFVEGYPSAYVEFNISHSLEAICNKKRLYDPALSEDENLELFVRELTPVILGICEITSARIMVGIVKSIEPSIMINEIVPVVIDAKNDSMKPLLNLIQNNLNYLVSVMGEETYHKLDGEIRKWFGENSKKRPCLQEQDYFQRWYDEAGKEIKKLFLPNFSFSVRDYAKILVKREEELHRAGTEFGNILNVPQYGAELKLIAKDMLIQFLTAAFLIIHNGEAQKLKMEMNRKRIACGNALETIGDRVCGEVLSSKVMGYINANLNESDRTSFWNLFSQEVLRLEGSVPDLISRREA